MLNVTAPDTATRPLSPDVEQAEAAIVEHYPRLVRLAYLVLPPALGRNRRVLTAHALAQRALPRGRREREAVPAVRGGVPGQRGGAPEDSGYAYVRLRVLRGALEGGLPLTFRALPRRAQLPPALPQVWGLRLFPRSGGAEELALDQWLATLDGPGRAACVLRALERLSEPEVLRVLDEAGVADPAAAVAGSGEPAHDALFASPEFDPCVLQARPTDLLRRRRLVRGSLAAAAALAVCGALLALPGGGWGADGAAAPPYALNPAAEQALDPGRLVRAAPTLWRASSRTDFSTWPARGDRADDAALLRRALAVWARPGASVAVSATPGTPAGPAMGPAQLLFAGTVDQAVVVLLYDGLRVVRYAEPRAGTAGAALDFARTDGASAQTAAALVLSRVDGNVRYLTAPWVTAVALRDLLKPGEGPTALKTTPDGVTPPVVSPAPAGTCSSWNALALTGDGATRLITDLGELTPARLTSGAPGAERDVTEAAELGDWSRIACLLPSVRSHGVRTVNAWTYAKQPLPEGGGTAAWLCTRAETWQGAADRVQAQFLAPGASAAAQAARAEGTPACGSREPRVLAGVLWKSRAGQWYVVAAGSAQFASVSASGGGVSGTANGNRLAVKAPAGAQVDLSGRLTDGSKAGSLR
ncbi:hypothetical protein OG479_11215 [Streptomyces subrutilus]|uniref:DNA-directed RNA polymerase specialized sigma24 family protein n=1 Tax=Streptomyces subrutilus TaxID=36818 RepID=A0A5P2URE6_9ACTN|nr:hypothetical protein [Streptomyces subrutilus]QEU80875.1 hypothetical protein CP968_23635 [Streptomyces subrutilus]WSJ34111.1 hypothetical protein OG479_11215 [Streptomyces subrutilus]